MDRVPYERVVMHGWVLDQHGRAMSKSLGNNVEPRDIIPQFGADSLRLSIVGGAAPWEDISFGTETVRNTQRTLNILWNVHVFATQYMAEDKYDGRAPPESALRAEDKWLLSRLQSTVADTTRHFEAYEFHKAVREIERFILEDLSRWYVRLVRERVWEEAESDTKRAAYHTLYSALHTTARLLAPFAPFTADAIYLDLTTGRAHPTVHMEDWPVADGALTDYDLERDMGTVRAVVEAAAYARQKANMKLRHPVGKLVVATDDADVRGALTRFRATLLEQSNAKDVEFTSGEWEKLDLAPVPNKQVIGKTFRAEGPKVLQAIAALDQTQLRFVRRAFAAGEKAPLDADGLRVELAPEILAFETKLPANVSGADFPGGSVYVDTEVSPELEAEGAARDLTRRIQEMRKALGLHMSAQVRVQVQAPAEFAALVQPHLPSVAEGVRAAGGLALVEKPEGTLVKEWDLEGVTLVIGMSPQEPAAHAPAADAPTATRPPAATAAKRVTERVKKAVVKKAVTKALEATRTRGAKVAKGAKKVVKKAPAKKAAKATKKAPAKKPAKKAPAKKPAKKGASKKAAKRGAAKKAAKKGKR